MSHPPQPSNLSTATNPVGRFMVAVGALVRLKETNNILLTQRAATLDWRPNAWEICYGRIDQFEDPEDGLRRELREETGILTVNILRPTRVWHIYRGSKAVENDLIGITYFCETAQKDIQISDEHQAFAWVTPTEALKRIQEPGIILDIQKAIELGLLSS